MAKDIDLFQKIVIDRFGSMPPWIRAVSYLTALIMSVYLTLCPNYVHGKVLMPGLEGGEMGYRDGAILVFYEDQAIPFDLKESGSFRVPVFSKLPWPPVELRVLRGRESFLVEVPIHKRLMPGPVDIYGQKDPWRFSLERPEILDRRPEAESLLSSLGIGGTALAQQPTPTVQDPATPTTQRAVEEIVEEAVIYAGHRYASRTKILGYDPVARSLVAGAIEEKYDIAIPSSDWRKLRTIEEIEAYLAAVGLDLRVRKILRDASTNEDLYVAPAIPPDKLANAREAAAVPDSEEVIGLLDATIFGSAKESMVFGKRGIYYRTSFSRSPRVAHLSYDSFPDREFQRAGFFEISLGSDPAGNEELRFAVAKTDFKAAELATLLNRIRDVSQRQTEIP